MAAELATSPGPRGSIPRHPVRAGPGTEAWPRRDKHVSERSLTRRKLEEQPPRFPLSPSSFSPLKTSPTPTPRLSWRRTSQVLVNCAPCGMHTSVWTFLFHSGVWRTSRRRPGGPALLKSFQEPSVRRAPRTPAQPPSTRFQISSQQDENIVVRPPDCIGNGSDLLIAAG